MTKRALVLVEGQTEERFVKDVLTPHFVPRDLYFYPTILVTRRVKDGPNFKGGVTSYARFRNDLNRVRAGAKGGLVTTILDYYGLPEDFPGMETRPERGTPEEKAAHVEQAVHSDLGSPRNLIVFLALHEFEAWLFSATEELPGVMAEREKQPAFAAIRNEFATPEEINERPQYCPSRRIVGLFPQYRKTLHGPVAAERIGLDRIRRECPHFNIWLGRLEKFANSPK